jgi:hypothetical protein
MYRIKFYFYHQFDTMLHVFRFRMVPAAFQMLHDDAERCLKRAIEVTVVRII